MTMQFLDNQKGAMNFSESLALKAVSLLLALILWITVLGFKKEEMRKNVKFEPLVAPGMMITNKIPSHIMFTLRGPRVLLNDVEKKLPPIRPDFRRSKDLTIPVAISEVLLGELPAGVTVISYHPSNLLIRLEEVVERNVPVRPSLRGLPAQGLRERLLDLCLRALLTPDETMALSEELARADLLPPLEDAGLADPEWEAVWQRGPERLWTPARYVGEG